MEETTRDLLKTFSSPSFKETLERDTMRVKTEFRNRQMFNVKLGYYQCTQTINVQDVSQHARSSQQ